MASSKINTRCGTIAIVGQPNVGKSTLLNYFVGSKLSITSRKAQTTRYQLVGIFTDKDTQYIFVDTPGYQLKHLNQMNKSLNKSVNQALKDVDLILFLSEPNELDATDKKILQMIPNSTPILLIINKIDLLPYVNIDVQKLKDYALKVNPNLQFFEVSATTGEGMEQWYKWLKENSH